MKSEPAAVRFARKVAPPNERGCRDWLGSRNGDGYGQFWDGTRMVKAHRYAYTQRHGNPPPAKPLVLHSCDNPACCEPTHLRPGTDRENAADKYARDRQVHSPGEANGNAKLTASAVATIRRLYRSGMTQAQLAVAFGVGQSHVSRIARGENWK